MAGIIEYKSDSAIVATNDRFSVDLNQSYNNAFVGSFDAGSTSMPSGNESSAGSVTIYAGISYRAPANEHAETNIPSVFYQISGEYRLSWGAIANRHFNANYVRLSVKIDGSWSTYDLSGWIYEGSSIGFAFYFDGISFPWWLSNSTESYLYVSENGSTWYYCYVNIIYRARDTLEINVNSEDDDYALITVENIPDFEYRRYVDLKWLISAVASANGVTLFKTYNNTTVFANYTYDGRPCIFTSKTWDGKKYVSTIYHSAEKLDVSNGYFSNRAILEEFHSSYKRFTLETSPYDWNSIELKDYNADGSTLKKSYPLKLSSVYKFTEPTREDFYVTSYTDTQTRTFSNGLSHAISLLNGNYSATISWARYTGVIQYNGNGATSGTDYEVSCQSGVSFTLADGTVFKRKGYEFSGWTHLPDGSGDLYVAGSSYTPHADANEFAVTFYAKWSLKKLNVRINDLEGIGIVYTGAYLYYLDTKISGLPATIHREGFTFIGAATDSTGSTMLTNASGVFYPSISGWTDSSGRFLLESDVVLFARWGRIEYTITFDSNEGENKQFSTIRTYEGKITAFPNVIRAGYELNGWTEDLSAQKITYVSKSTIFSKNTTIYADWEEVKVNTGVQCYLERILDGTRQRMNLPIISSIEDTMSVSLVEMDTIMYGYKNRFVIDTGTKQTFSVTVERVNPVDFDDSDEGAVVERFSNSKWWATFVDFINFWQNDGRSMNYERTGGFRFVYAPATEEGSLDLYPHIEKNVFISGQISVQMSPGIMRFTLPLVVATMDANATVPTWKATFRKDNGSNDSFEVEAVIGLDMTLPSPDAEWGADKLQNSAQSFSHWISSGGKVYSAGETLNYDSEFLEKPLEFYAVWKNISETRIYCIEGNRAFPESNYTYTATEKCTVTATLYGGGGTGGRGERNYKSWTAFNYDCPAGGGGGAPVATVHAFSLVADNKLKMTIGSGGNVKSGEADSTDPGNSDGKKSTIYQEGFSGSLVESRIGTSGGVEIGGSANGGEGGDEDENGQDGKGSFGGKGGIKEIKNEGFGVGTEYYGGGGGGGSIKAVSGTTFTCAGITYKSAYTFTGGTVYLNDTPIDFTDKKHLDIISWGGAGATYGKDMQYTTICDAKGGYVDLGEDTDGIRHLALFAAAGGGGRCEWGRDDLGNRVTPFARGSDGFIILSITTG